MRINLVTAIGAMVAMLSLSWATGASAETYSPGFSGGERMGKQIGGSGGAPFQARCPMGESYLAGLEVTTNERISTVKLICAPRQNDQLGASARFGPDIGVPQSGRYSAVCPNGGAVNGINVFADGYDIIGVWTVDLRCGNAHGALPIGSPEYINFQGSAQLDKLTSTPRQADGTDECPPGYVAKGVWGRYGVFIDAIGLICDWPPPNAPPPPPAPPVVYKHTGAPNLPPAPFTGTWHVTSSLGNFDLGMLQVSTGLIVGSISDGNARDAGTVRGIFGGPNRAHLGFTQSGLGRQGSVDVVLRSDGLNFQGLGTVTGSSTPITWSADKK